MARFVASPGDKFGRLTYVQFLHWKYFDCGKKQRVGLWLCDCGKDYIGVNAPVQRGQTISCGCFRADRVVDTLTTHGLTKTRIYRIYGNMKSRCDRPYFKSYADYGGRGITYDPKWRTFEGFYKDMAEGYADNLEIDRIDVNGNYEKSNCRWVTPLVNASNKRNTVMVEYRGQRISLAVLCRDLNINSRTINQRIKRGNMTVEQAIERSIGS